MLLALLLGAVAAPDPRAETLNPGVAALSPPAHTAPAIATARVVPEGSYERRPGGAIYSRWRLLEVRPLKGRLPPTLSVELPGGEVPGRGAWHGCVPRIRGTNGLFCLERRADGTLALYGGTAGTLTLDRLIDAEEAARAEALLADLERAFPDPATAGEDLSAALSLPPPPGLLFLLTNSAGISSRFIPCDRGEPLHFVVDAGVRPSGISTAQVMVAISNALQAWSRVTSLRFEHAGFASFGTGSPQLTNEDERLWIQTGDPYGETYDGILGRGGRYYVWNSPWQNGGEGGRLDGAELFRSVRGYVVLRSQDAALSDTNTLAEVLCHEIGHALSLAHPSENPVEPDPLFGDAIMYYRAHQDGRGARLNTTDVLSVRQLYPSNTPPYGYPRRMEIVTASPQPTVSVVNVIEPRGYDLQGDALNVILTNQSGPNGSFALTNGMLRYTASAAWNDGQGNYGTVYVRWSDGTNLSPPAAVRVTSFARDRLAPSDGLPDYWMSNHFGHADGRVADLSRPDDDPDQDGHSNLDEYVTGYNPVSWSSRLCFIASATAGWSWLARSNDLYELQSSASATGPYRQAAFPVLSTGETASAVVAFTNPAAFYSVRRVP